MPALDSQLAPSHAAELAEQLARFAYPGFVCLQKPSRPKNPAATVAAAVVHSDLDPRIVEALP